MFLFGGTLSQLQVDIIEALLNECDRQEVKLFSQVAYIMATTYHECYNWNEGYEGRMVQLQEMGSPEYLKSKRYYPYFGRGMSHLTWRENYLKEGKRIRLDLVRFPNLMLDVNIAAESHVWNMMNGGYCKRKLSNGKRESIKLTDYVNDKGVNFESARKVINPSDITTYKIVADYARLFNKCLNLSVDVIG